MEIATHAEDRDIEGIGKSDKKPVASDTPGPRKSAARRFFGSRCPPVQGPSGACRLLGDEAQRHAVVAVAKAGRLRAVVEDVAVVPAAAHAMVLGALHEELAVFLGLECPGDRGEKARPAGTAVEFHR